uniref:Uncharacterized protein n=1 Tax=Pararge aegeria TaxID=116150 RepID=S4P395_9NEOP
MYKADPKIVKQNNSGRRSERRLVGRNLKNKNNKQHRNDSGREANIIISIYGIKCVGEETAQAARRRGPQVDGDATLRRRTPQAPLPP